MPASSLSLARIAGLVRSNRGFRRLFFANAVSQLGDWFSVVAVFSLVLDLTGKGEAIALVLVTRLVPYFLAGPAAGVLADRISRKALLVACDLFRAALVLCLALVHDPSRAWIAYALLTLHSVASGFFEPAQAASLPELVEPEDRVVAAGLENALWSAMLTLGALLGGLALTLVGREAAFAVDSLSFVASALLLRGLPLGERPPSRPGARIGFGDYVEGARYLLHHRRARAVILVKGAFGFTLGGVLALLPFFGERVFSPGASHAASGKGIALLYTARGVGSFLGPFVAGRLVGDDPRALRRGIAVAFATIALAYVALALAPALGLAAVALAIANAGGSILWTYGSALLWNLVEDRFRGRVFAAEMGGFTLAMAASTLAVGRALDAGVPARVLMAGCGLVALAPLVYWIGTPQGRTGR